MDRMADFEGLREGGGQGKGFEAEVGPIDWCLQLNLQVGKYLYACVSSALGHGIDIFRLSTYFSNV